MDLHILVLSQLEVLNEVACPGVLTLFKCPLLPSRLLIALVFMVNYSFILYFTLLSDAKLLDFSCYTLLSDSKPPGFPFLFCLPRDLKLLDSLIRLITGKQRSRKS